mgnify:CR=1 FL=1
MFAQQCRTVVFATNSILVSSKLLLNKTDKVAGHKPLSTNPKDSGKEFMVTDPVRFSINNHRMLEQLMDLVIEAKGLTRALSVNNLM